MAAETDDTLPATPPQQKEPGSVGGRGMRVSRRALRNAFASKLPELVGSICQHWNACVDDPQDFARFAELGRAVSSLASAARTFRQPEVSAAAARIEAYLGAITQDDRVPSSAEGSKIAQMIADLVEVVDTLPDAETVIDAAVVELANLQEELRKSDPTTERTHAPRKPR